jgi:DNA polymerase alpha subunit A
VTDDQYRSIVGARLNQDDFIIDDDGSGYVDNGEDDWDNRDEEEESEDEDYFEGEDEELTKGENARIPLRARQSAQV